MAKRTTYSLPGLSASNAVAPDLVKTGNLFFTSGVRGVDLKTGELPSDPAAQFLNAWHNLAALVEGAGLSIDNIGLVTNFVESQAFGVLSQRRACIEVKGLTHRDPLPNAVRMGDYVFSSVIVPWDLSTSEPVVGEDAQTDQCFDNMRILMEQAGGSIDDVVLQWVYLNDFAYQPYMVDVYLEAWPVGQYQAARKTFRYPMGAQIQIQCIGRVGGTRSNHEIPGHGHHDPIPMGARIGDVFASSGVSGVDPASADKLEPVEGAAGQSHFGLRNVRALAESGGMSADDIGHITVLIQDYKDVEVVDQEWRVMFPDPAHRPARQVMQLGLQRKARVQFHMLA